MSDDLTVILDKLDKLNLYEVTRCDWVLEIHHVLTEPVCPTVVIRPEELQTSRYRVDVDTIEEEITRAVDLILRDFSSGGIVDTDCPWTNSDDKILLGWIAKWQRKEKLTDEDLSVTDGLHDDPYQLPVRQIPRGFHIEGLMFLPHEIELTQWLVGLRSTDSYAEAYGPTPRAAVLAAITKIAPP